MNTVKNYGILYTIELLSAKLFHDFAGSVGAIANCVEFLNSDDQEMQQYALSLLAESSDDIMSKFKLLKQAYNFSESNMYFHETQATLKKYLSRKKLELHWDINHLNIVDSTVTEKINKLIVNVVILSIFCMINGTKIVINFNQENDSLLIKITCHAKKIEIHKSVLNALYNNDELELSTINIQAYFTSLLLVDYKANITHIINKDNSILEFTITYPFIYKS